MKNLNLTLNRTARMDAYTIGVLCFDGVRFCDTIEDRVRILNDKNLDGDFDDVGEGKIYGETAIPDGVYEVILSMSNRFKRELPLLLNVPGFEGVRIHSGNTQEDSHGCIIVGTNDKKGWVSNSRTTEILLIKKLKHYLANNYKIKLTIV